MAASTERRRSRFSIAASVFLLVAALVWPVRLHAQDGTVRIFASALNDFAAAIQPLTITRSFTAWIVAWVPNPFLLGIPTPVPVPIPCTATGAVTGLTFDITPTSASVRGNLRGTVCGIAYSSTIASPVMIAIDSAKRLVIRPVSPMLVGATVNVMGFNIPAPFSANLSPSISVMTIPLNAVPFEVEAPSGLRTLTLAARNHQLSLHAGYFEIKVDASLR